MNVKEYYKKFPNPKETDVIEIFKAFNDEAMHMLEVRRVTDNAGVQAIITEQNIKWNGLYEKYVTKYAHSVISYSGFREFWIRRSKEAHKQVEVMEEV